MIRGQQDAGRRRRERELRPDGSLQRRHLAGDDAARTELIERYLPLARSLARRFGDRGELLDLTQVACVGLLKAVERWDPERGTAFSTFAVPTILGELRRHFRDNTWAIKPPRDLQELFLKVCRAREALWQELGREPTARDVAAHLGVTLEDVAEAVEAGATRESGSLDEPLRDDEAGGATMLDRAADANDQYEAADTAIALEQLSSVLDARSREVVRLRYGEDLLQREIAERVGCSQMHVSRILQEAMTTLRASAAPELLRS